MAMGKASRLKERSAREKIAAQREAARRAEMRRRIVITGGSIVAVAAIVIAFVVIKALSGGQTAGKTVHGSSAAAVLRTVSQVPPSTLTAVGAGTGQSNGPRRITGTPLTQNGKPEVLYMGAEYCPFCAAERWALTVALSRFGTFSGVGLIHSAGPPEVFPSTATLTYYKSSYTSKYLTFTPVEMQTVTHATLQKPSPQQAALLARYDAPPYVPASSQGAIPFIDLANKYGIIGGSSFQPGVLRGLTWSQIAAALSAPASPVAKQADGAANYLTAAICKITNGQPASVCSSPMIKTLQVKGKL
jgi:Domain of unknown function (DUF929)